MYLDCYKYISKTLLKCKINAKIFIWQLKKKNLILQNLINVC